ncbi:hypothetical protein ACNAQI_29390 [Pseudomonas aeruginosa]|uniref:hypothetical protein n=1 Tax=Pseudomonas aeruginosa TaxID=287 RepID=UPI003A4E5264
MSNELTDVRCSCGDEYPADSYDAGFIAGSGMCQNCDAALTPKDICTCPSGDGSLRHPCPAHIGPFDKLVGSPVHNESEPDLPPLDEHLAQVFETGMALSESVEQAGGDERDLQAEGAQGELLPCPFCGGQAHLTYDDYVHDDLRPMPVVECNACHTWVRAESWNKRAALAQPSPAQAEGAQVIGCLCGMLTTEGHHSPDGCCNLEEFAPEAERPEVVARVVHSNPVVLDHCGPLNANDELMTVAQHERIVGDLQRQKHEADTALAWATRHYQTVEQERDAALAKLAELEAKLSDPTAVHQWQFSNAWFDGSEEVVLKAGKEGSPIRTLYAAPVAQAQPEETPGEILAAKLIETWVTKHGKPAPWSTAVEITAVATNMPNDERERLLALDDDVDAQAQHSVPETINEEANSFLRIADAGQFKDNAVAVRTAAVIIRGLLHRPPLMQSIIRHRIGLTPEYEGQWHADLYGEDGEVQHHAEADTPDEAVRAVVALAAAPGKEGL